MFKAVPNTAQWRLYAQKLFRYFSRRRGFQMRDYPDGLAAVNIKGRVLYLNLALLEAMTPRRRESYVVGLMGHEAAHVLETDCAKPPGLLGQIFNCLEDSRIERIMQAHYPSDRLPEHWAVIQNDLYDQNCMTHTEVIHGPLMYRLYQGWRPSEGADLRLWPEVMALIEQAWAAATSAEALECARQIMALLGYTEATPERDDLSDPHPFYLPIEQGEEEGEEVEGWLEGVGVGQEERPQAPIDPVTLPDDLEGQARSLARLFILPKGQLETSSASRGRFDFERYHAGSPRFMRHKTQPRPRPVDTLWLVVDASGSMRRNWPDAFRTMALVAQAAQLGDVGLEIAFFDEGYRTYSGYRGFAEALNETPDGGTILNPVLSHALSRFGPNDLMVLITDGELGGNDLDLCKAALAGADKSRILPILIGSPLGRDGYRRLFGRVVVLEGAETGSLAARVKNWFENRLSKSAA